MLGWVGLGIHIFIEPLGDAVLAGPGATIWGALLTNILAYQRQQKELLLGEGCDIIKEAQRCYSGAQIKGLEQTNKQMVIMEQGCLKENSDGL